MEAQVYNLRSKFYNIVGVLGDRLEFRLFWNATKRMLRRPLPPQETMSDPTLDAPTLLASADESAVRALFDHLPDVQYWIKDAQGRYAHVNRGFLENYAFDDVAQVLGKTDYDIAPPYLADAWVRDDREVLQGHEAINHIELVGHVDRTAGWFMTTKLPLRSRQGDIIGTTGITLALKGPTERLWPYAELDAVVRHVRENIDRPIGVSELAQLASLSASSPESVGRCWFG